MPSMQGHESRVMYLHEDNGFAANPSDTTYKTFGANASLTQARGQNNAVSVFEPSNRDPADTVARAFEGAFSVEFDYTNPWWANFLFGSPSVTGSSAPYTYTWAGNDTQPQRIYIGQEATNADERELLGCVATRVGIRPSVNGMARVTIEGAYADESLTEDTSLTSQTTIDEKPMTFADALLQDGTKGGSPTTIGLVQQANVQLQSNADTIHEMGTRVGVDYAERQLQPSVNWQSIKSTGQVEQLQRMYGDSTGTSVQEDITSDEARLLTLDNGLSGSDKNRFDVEFNIAFPDSYDEQGHGDPAEDIQMQINELCEGVTLYAEVDESSAQ